MWARANSADSEYTTTPTLTVVVVVVVVVVVSSRLGPLESKDEGGATVVVARTEVEVVLEMMVGMVVVVVGREEGHLDKRG